MSDGTKEQIVDALLELADEPYVPELADEDYSVAKTVVKPSQGKTVNISFEEFKRQVDEAFRKRMAKVLYPATIESSIASEVYKRCVENKYKELRRDDNNERISHTKVVRGHIASLMHCLFLVFS